jgi:folate-binding protein YgfZ
MIDRWYEFLAARSAKHPYDPTAAGRPPAGEAIMADLPHLACIAIDGADARGFLHSQLTADVQALGPARWVWAGYCSPKGRLLGVLRVACCGEGFVAETTADVADDLVARLRRFVLRSKVGLGSLRGQWVGIGVSGERARDLIAQCFDGAAPGPGCAAWSPSGIAFGIADGRWEVHLALEAAEVLWTRLEAVATPAPAPRWRALDIVSGIPWIEAAAQDAYIPQMVDLERIGGVSFTKGCYPGQEIVARSQYLGQVKRRLHVGSSERYVAPATPLAAVEAGAQPVGSVLACAPRVEGGFAVLGVLDASLAAAGPVVTQPDGTPVTALRRAHDDA